MNFGTLKGNKINKMKNKQTNKQTQLLLKDQDEIDNCSPNIVHSH